MSALVIVAGEDRDHDLIGASSVFRDLATRAGFAATRSIGLKRFVEPLPVTAAAGVYLFYTVGGEFPIEQQSALVGLVAAGKGVVAFHRTNQGFEEDGQGANGGRAQTLKGPFAELVGGWSNAAPEPAAGGEVVVSAVCRHSVTRGLGSFRVWDLVPEVSAPNDGGDVLAICEDKGGRQIPVVCVRKIGRGRLCYVALGHDRRCWGSPGFGTLTEQALRWVAGG